jgi:hypothetical protein
MLSLAFLPLHFLNRVARRQNPSSETASILITDHRQASIGISSLYQIIGPVCSRNCAHLMQPIPKSADYSHTAEHTGHEETQPKTL